MTPLFTLLFFNLSFNERCTKIKPQPSTDTRWANFLMPYRTKASFLFVRPELGPVPSPLPLSPILKSRKQRSHARLHTPPPCLALFAHRRCFVCFSLDNSHKSTPSKVSNRGRCPSCVWADFQELVEVLPSHAWVERSHLFSGDYSASVCALSQTEGFHWLMLNWKAVVLRLTS